MKDHNKLALPTVVAAALATALSGPVAAADGSVHTYVERVMVNADDLNGGCMAKLSVPPQSVLPDCAPDWVSFGCSGDFVSPVRAYRMVDQAQLALATGYRADVWFNDELLHDGHCFAYRIDVYDE